MKQNKQMYLSPETEVLVVRFEDSLLTGGSQTFSSKGTELMTMDSEEDF